ncbi:hypothetical protein ACWDHH_06825 [Janibacter hoylei]|uniref:hypothetical protein n=1 Tax=Janibacter hoylei TaxID=364298 RepID=UPI002238AFC2|nr:hypothetical protein [Janibacter hoylei]MCW4601873.1 hypothetical protein [Janibacter hoylei]
MKTSRIASLTSVLAAASVIGLASAGPASAATPMSATVYGATVRGNIYTGDMHGGRSVTFSGVLKDTARTNGYPAKLYVQFDVLRHGSSTIYKAFEGSATWSTTTSRRVGLGVTPSNSARKARVKYRVCSRTCSSWQTSPWSNV